jgi:hypothetical protein
MGWTIIRMKHHVREAGGLTISIALPEEKSAQKTTQSIYRGIESSVTRENQRGEKSHWSLGERVVNNRQRRFAFVCNHDERNGFLLFHSRN